MFRLMSWLLLLNSKNSFMQQILMIIICSGALIFILSKCMVIIHELGHLCFGLISGYQFLSFRIGKISLINLNGHLKLMKHNIKGSSGQCLLLPNKKKKTYFWMVIGGVVMNFIFGIATGILAFHHFSYPFKVILYLNSFLNISGGLLNVLPSKKFGVETDGLVLKNLFKDEIAVRVYNLQLMIANELMQGKTYGEMDESLFTIDDNANLLNEINASMYLYRCYREEERKNYFGAKRELNKIKVLEHHYTKSLQEDIGTEEMFLRMIQMKDGAQDYVLNSVDKESNSNLIRVKAASAFLLGDMKTFIQCRSKLDEMESQVYKGEVLFNQNVITHLVEEGGNI